MIEPGCYPLRDQVLFAGVIPGGLVDPALFPGDAETVSLSLGKKPQDFRVDMVDVVSDVVDVRCLFVVTHGNG